MSILLYQSSLASGTPATGGYSVILENYLHAIVNGGHMQKNTAGKWTVYAFQDEGGANPGDAVTGDAANITANIRIDGGAANAVDDTNPTELEDGYYVFDITATESNGDQLTLAPATTTANTKIIGTPPSLYTTPLLNTTALGNIGIDWANVENPTTALDLSATDIQLCDTTTVATTATNLTNLPTIPANWLTAAGIATSALDGKGDWNIGKTGYALTQTFPSNFADMSISVTTGLMDISQTAADKVWSTAARVLTASTNFNDLATGDIDARLAAIGLDHLLSGSVTGTDVADNSIIARLVSSSATADWDDFVNTTESLQALRDRGDAAWITGGGGGLTQAIIPIMSVPAIIDLADTATIRVGVILTNALDDLPTTAEITPGTITIWRKAKSGTSWTSVVAAAAMTEQDGFVYYDEVFDSGTGYAEGDMIRYQFESTSVTADTNTYNIFGATGVYMYSHIGEIMVGTNSANTTTPPTVELIRAEMDSNSTQLAKLGTPAADIAADVAAVKVDTAATLIDTAQIGTAGAGLTNINLPNQTMDITGDITGNLSGSVGSVTGAVGSLTGHTVQTGDSFGRIGAPVGADISADIAAVKADSTAILIDTGTTLPAQFQQQGIHKNQAFNNFEFLMVLSSDDVTPATSKTVTGQRSIDGAAFATAGGAIAEVSNGIYQFDALSADTNGDVITWRFTATDCNDTFVTFKTVQ